MEEREDHDDMLNASQRQILAITLRHVEMAAWRLEDQLMRTEMPRLALTHWILPSESQQRLALLHLTRRIRQEIANIAAAYHLEAQEEPVLKATRGAFTLLWADLEDTRPQKLRGYGALPLQAEAVLHPHLQRVIDLVLAVNEVADGKQEAVLKWENAAEDGDCLHPAEQ
jgi:hypothetical protein